MNFLILLSVFFSCQYSEKQDNRGKFYESYDLFNLNGEKEINNVQTYPSISIANNSDQIIIKHYLAKDSIIENVYTKCDSFYKRNFDVNFGMSTMNFEEFHFANKIIILQFNTSIKKGLSSISEFKNNILTSYIFKKELPAEMGINEYLNMINTNEVYAVRRIFFSKQNEQIVVNINFENKVSPELSNERHIEFSANGKSLNNWIIFKWGYYVKSLIYIDDTFLPNSSPA